MKTEAQMKLERKWRNRRLFTPIWELVPFNFCPINLVLRDARRMSNLARRCRSTNVVLGNTVNDFGRFSPASIDYRASFDLMPHPVLEKLWLAKGYARRTSSGLKVRTNCVLVMGI